MNKNFTLFTNEQELFLIKEYSFERENSFDFDNSPDIIKRVEFKAKNIFKVVKTSDSSETNNSSIHRQDSLTKKKRNYRLNPDLKETSHKEFNRRKWRKDSFMKRIRRVFFKYLVKICFDKYKIKINFNNSLKSNISIDFNTNIFQMNVEEVFKKFISINDDYLKLKNHSEITSFFETPLSIIYDEFLVSKFFEDAQIKIQMKEGKDFLHMFTKLSLEFVDFYLMKPIVECRKN